MKYVKHITRFFMASVVIASLLIVASVPVYTYAVFSDELTDKEYIKSNNNNGLVLYDRDGVAFFAFYQAKIADYTTIDKIPLHLQKAVIAAEDKNFYTNAGFSLRGIGRAALANLKAGTAVQGGSTITQGLVKNQLLSPKKSVLRKYQEITLAYLINRNFSKEEILEMYLNSAYFGQGAIGVKSAASTYFGKDVGDLTLSESALLAGLLPAPSHYSPFASGPDIAIERKNMVISEMLNDKTISQDEAEIAFTTEIDFNSQKDDINTLAAHFAIFVRDMLIRTYGEEEVIRSGFRVKTTLDSNWQMFAEKTVQNEVVKLAKNKATNGASVVIDPANGDVLVMVGSVDWHNGEYGKMNMAITPRQSGSAYKPLIYAAAIEDRLVSPLTMLKDTPTTFQRNYKPRNYDGRFRGPVTVKRALANSLNVPSVELMQNVGIKRALDMSKKLGIMALGDDTSKYGLSLVLGAGEVSLLELTNAYATFANSGKRYEPRFILEIKDKFGNIVNIPGNSSIQAVGSDTAFLISSILSDRFARSEVFGSVLNINRNAAVKTGTTQDYRGALTVGYTPSIVVGVWVGNNNNAPMDKVAGSLGAAPIWKQLMEEYLKNSPDEEFYMPENIEKVSICQVVGDEDNRTTRTFSEYAIKETAKSRACPVIEPKPEEGGEENNGETQEQSPEEPHPDT